MRGVTGQSDHAYPSAECVSFVQTGVERGACRGPHFSFAEFRRPLPHTCVGVWCRRTNSSQGKLDTAAGHVSILQKVAPEPLPELREVKVRIISAQRAMTRLQCPHAGRGAPGYFKYQKHYADDPLYVAAKAVSKSPVYEVTVNISLAIRKSMRRYLGLEPLMPEH